jgi:hypothetical protein
MGDERIALILPHFARCRLNKQQCAMVAAGQLGSPMASGLKPLRTAAET